MTYFRSVDLWNLKKTPVALTKYKNMIDDLLAKLFTIWRQREWQ